MFNLFKPKYQIMMISAQDYKRLQVLKQLIKHYDSFHILGEITDYTYESLLKSIEEEITELELKYEVEVCTQ